MVLDEADEMLSMGFKDDLDEILADTPQDKQTLLFSATMPKEARYLANKYMNNPAEVKISPTGNIGSKNITHNYYVVNARDRYMALKRLVDFSPEIYGIIFCRTKKETKDIADQLIQDGYSADALHGDLSQAQRDYVMSRFRNKMLQILVATDVAARGIDINELTHVINYNLPDDDEVYVHRSGRTGRAGNVGSSLTIITSRETGKIRSIEGKVGKMNKCMVPDGKEICKNQLFSTMNKIHEIEINHEEIDEYLPAIYTQFEDMDREEILQRLVSVEFNRFLDYYKGSKDINASEGRGGRETDAKFTRFFINHGRKSRLNPGDLLTLINQNITSKIDIGSIDILDSFSFFEAESKFAAEILKGMNDSEFRGERVSVEEAQQKGSKGGRSSRGGGSRDRGFGGDKKRSFGGSSDRSSKSGGSRFGGSKPGSTRSKGRHK